VWQEADRKGESYFPYQFLYRILLEGRLEQYYEIDPKDSWMLAAAQKNIPIVTPGWEDSTTGNIYAGHCISGDIKNQGTVKNGIQAMMMLCDWYTQVSKDKRIGFFQIGGGIAGDFPICVVPMINQDLQRDVPVWGYFCQISDAPTSYGGYSGAIPNEKITWGKLDLKSYSHVIESDATIVAPLMFAYLLGW
jgi:deoxyhypusine synthase